MSVPLVDTEPAAADVERMFASIASLVLWVVVPLVVAGGAATYFLDVDAEAQQATPAWSVIAWYAVLAVLVVLTGLAGRRANGAIGVTVVLVAIEFAMVSLITAVLWPLAVLDRHPFLGASSDPVLPAADLPQSIERWLSSAMTGYPVLVALVISILRAVARRRGWSDRFERRVLYIAFATLVVVGVAAVVAIELLKQRP
jgi:hypothetical protein